MLLTAVSLYKSNQILSVNQRIAVLYLRNRYRERYRFSGGILQVIIKPFSLPGGPVISIFRPAFARPVVFSGELLPAYQHHWFLLSGCDGQ